MLMNVNALSSQSHTLPFPNLPQQPMKQQGLQAGLIRAGKGSGRGKASGSSFRPLSGLNLSRERGRERWGDYGKLRLGSGWFLLFSGYQC